MSHIGKTKKLYQVTIKKPDTFFVIAENPSAAYESVRRHLDAADYYLFKDRELKTITLLAERTPYPDCGTSLVIDD